MAVAPQQTLVDVADAERSLLSGMLLMGSVDLGEGTGLSLTWRFSDRRHRTLFREMLRIARVGESLDRITLVDALTDAGTLEAAGGVGYIDEIDSLAPAISDLALYANIIRAADVARRKGEVK